MAIRMVVGLGNPDERYAVTRHNIGYRVIDELKGDPPTGVKLFKPKGYMNSSGISVSEMVRKNGYRPEEILVICDDFSIPLGMLRIRVSGSSGGHNGLGSIIQSLGTDNIPRVRAGIGPVPSGQDPAEFVLERIRDMGEASKAEVMIGEAAQAVRVAISEGMEIAMNRFNRRAE
jgi:PTH1 family peptidyl-tRNA hydrolase